MKFKLIHKEWIDYIIIEDNMLTRVSSPDEKGEFILQNNVLYINWFKWGKELFICYKNDNIYYSCYETFFNHIEWDDFCYIDYINNIITKKKNSLKGFFEMINDEMIISWDNETEDYNSFETNSLESVFNESVSNELASNETIPNETIPNEIVEIIPNKIPNIIHFIYGFKEQNEEFDLYRYIAIKSAYDVNRPDKIYLYYYYEPYGIWWEKLKSFVILERIDLPTSIFENKLYHYAHKADIIRLQKLIEHGGIYLDIDTICLKSFSNLLTNDFIMGVQNNSDNTGIYGLCNAVILSKPNSEFAIKWLESYHSFRSKGRDEFWDEHSVLKPLELSKIYPNEIKILNFESFFNPLWYNINDILFNEKYNIDEYKKIIENNYCIHLWDTYSNKYLKTLNENTILTKNTLFNIFARKFLRNNISLVFLTYNRFEITKKCLDSYLKCLDLEFIKELIILDNNSDYETSNYLQEFQKNNKKIKLILSDDNLGVCGGRIILFKEAKGDIIISIDSDAYLIDESIFTRIRDMLYDEKYGIIGISGAYIRSWEFGKQEDISNDNENEYVVDHIAGCFQAFRRDLFNFNFDLDPFYGKFWVEDTDLSMQSLYLNKINYRINQKKYIDHVWGGSGRDYKDLFESNWNYFVNKWKGKVLNHLSV